MRNKLIISQEELDLVKQALEFAYVRTIVSDGDATIFGSIDNDSVDRKALAKEANTLRKLLDEFDTDSYTIMGGDVK